ncbi:SGNH/GDSL hydrolase family protein [Pseudotabrizicola algicola]|uniref:SGNH/GDSL hydrolase family protein n=1 Tax=Pseudotabrizicola algicola TaxID=2709381 RepID=A0A6B3RNK7_9RHOB|nr:SGNH/GDSL hydrolase family protein [Pseudotabrizicola algicola]NEX47031.1 SGNH/GDSL hydrolase family protein [Pseudotabrizicola algicola]
MIRITLMLVALAALFGCGEPVAQGSAARILLLGDSMFATNRASNRAVADVLEAELGQEVLDRSVFGARYFHPLPLTGAAGMRLESQYREGDWDWVVMNGGGNDLLLGCGCSLCQGVLNRLVSADGRSGTIPAHVARIRASGARVVYAGYLRNPGMGTPIKHCGPAGNELDRRLALMAGFDAGVTFVPMADLVPYRDTSYHGPDRIHPSVKGSQGIGARLAAVMKSKDRPETKRRSRR